MVGVAGLSKLGVLIFDIEADTAGNDIAGEIDGDDKLGIVVDEVGVGVPAAAVPVVGAGIVGCAEIFNPATKC